MKAVEEAFAHWLGVMLASLSEKPPKLTRVVWSRGVFDVRTARHKVKGLASAPLSLLTGLLFEHDHLAASKVYEQRRGRGNAALTLLQDGAPQQAYFALLQELHRAKAGDEARLGLLLAIDVTDPQERKLPVFQALFPAPPKALLRSGSAGSEAAFLERRLKERGATAIDALLLARDLYEHVSGAISDVARQHARLLKLLRAADAAVTTLSARRELGTRDLVRLVRQEIAASLAFRFEQP